MNRILFCFLLLLCPFVGHAQVKTWIGDATTIYPSQGTNGVRIGIAGTNTSVTINNQHSTTRFKFNSSSPTAAGTAGVLGRDSSTQIVGYSTKTIDDLDKNIYNADGDITGNRIVNGDGHSLTFLGNSTLDLIANNNLSITAGNSILQNAPSIFLTPTAGGLVVLNNGSTTTNRYLFTDTFDLASGDDAVMFRKPAADGTDGTVRYDPAITYAVLAAGIAGGQNFANTDLTFTGDRTHNADGKFLWVQNFGALYFEMAGGDNSHLYMEDDLAGNVNIEMRTEGGNEITFRDDTDDPDNNFVRIIVGDTSQLRLQLPSVNDGTGLVGQFLRRNDTLGAGDSDFATVYFTGLATGTPGTWVADTATLVPAYDDGAQPPEGTIAYLKFNSNSVGSDTLQLGDSTTGIAITRANGVAIQADDITAGQYVMLVRSGTLSGSHWVCESCGVAGVAPASGSVVAVDTASDLASEVAAVVITQGYSTVGDGGHGAYRADSLSSETINNVTVFDRSAGGRYLLMVSGAISAKQAGAVGDGSTDDHDALQALFDVCVNLAARIEPLSYLSTGGLTVPAGVRVIAHGATITCDTSGNDDRAIDMESNTKWEGGTVIDHRVSGGDSGEDHVAFRIGHYTGGVGSSNVVIKSVTISTDWNDVNANGIIVTGSSHDIDIQNLNVEDNSTIRTIIANHWGFVVAGDATQGTVHPYNINIENVNVGQLTAATGDVTPVAISACYNVNVNNVRSKRARYGLIYVCGDYGYRYSGFQGLVMGSVNVNNLTCERGYNAGVLVIGVDINGDVWPLEGSINNFTLIGSNDGTGQGGIYLQSANGTTFRSGTVSGFEVGTVFDDGSKNIGFYDTLFTTNRLGGFVINDAGSSNVVVSRCKFYNNAAGLSGTNAAAIRLLDGANARIVDCEIGNSYGTEDHQEVGVQCISPFLNATIQNNYVLKVSGGGVNVGYHFGGTSDTGHLWLVSGNQAASGITLISGPDQIPYTTRGKYRVFTGTATPTVGTYLKGDMVIFNEATSTPFAKICSVAGTPGTWVTTY